MAGKDASLVYVLDIIDGSSRNAKPCARLRYDPMRETYSIRISDDADPSDVPLALSSFACDGKRDVADQWARRWVATRVVPSGRQNLGEVLRANGLAEYDELRLLAASGGMSSDDDFVVRAPDPDTLGQCEVAAPGARVSADVAACQLRRDVGAEFKRARLEAGMSQHELAAAAGVRQDAISRLENGVANPTLSFLASVAAALGFSPTLRLDEGDAPVPGKEEKRSLS